MKTEQQILEEIHSAILRAKETTEAAMDKARSRRLAALERSEMVRDILDTFEAAVRTAQHAIHAANSCGTRHDHEKADRAEDALSDARDAVLTELTGSVCQTDPADETAAPTSFVMPSGLVRLPQSVVEHLGFSGSGGGVVFVTDDDGTVRLMTNSQAVTWLGVPEVLA